MKYFCCPALNIFKIELLVTSWPGFIIGLNMFAIDIKSLGGIARRKNGSEEEMFYHLIHYNLQEETVILFAGNSLLEPGDTVIPHIEYEANVNFNVMFGYGIWREPCGGSQEPGAKQCWFTMFAATGARQLLPCFDEPSAKAFFTVREGREMSRLLPVKAAMRIKTRQDNADYQSDF